MSRLYRNWLPLTFAACALVFASSASAQVAGQNVNMVSGTSWPGGDPFLQRQNEPSMAVSTRNPMHILAGANDYRTVDLETVLSGGQETGDSWLGLFKSFDGGLTWKSTLLPGCKYADPQCVDNGALHGGHGYDAGSDPVVRAGTNGMFYYAGLAFDRATSPTTASGTSSIFVARYNDLNNNENADPITYLDTHIVAMGNNSEFLDKPSLAVDIPRSGATTCSFTAQEPGVGTNGGALSVHQSFAAGNVYMSYTDFLAGTKANSTPTHLMFTRSTDCGVTWSAPVQINSGTTTSQGSAIAVNALNGNVYVTWRQFASTGIPDAMMIAVSTNAGRTFGAPVRISTFTPFDQGTTNTSIRTNAYPSITTDNFGFVYVAFSAKGMVASGDARVVAAGSLDGTHWTPPIMVDNPSTNAQTNPSGRGHQIMPAISFANGRLTILYYDLRLDHYENVYTSAPKTPTGYTSALTPEGELPATPSKVFTPFIDDLGLTLRRHTLDLRVLQLGIFPTITLGPSVLVSQYAFGCCVNPNLPSVEQFKFNVPNLPIFSQGEVPFLGDYIDVVPSPAFVPSGTSWAYNFTPSVNPQFHATWTDNRDVVPPANGDWTHYTPPVPAGTTSVFQPGQPVVCTPGQEGMRNQNIYTAQITGGLIVGAPGNSKPLGNTTFNGGSVPFQRAFAVEAQNVTSQPLNVRFSIANQPAGGKASFLQFSQLITLDVTIPAFSSVSRSVFVTSTNAQASVTVNVVQIASIGGSPTTNGLSQSAVINPDVTNPNITNPNVTNPNITNPNITNFEVTNPNVTNPNITNPNVTNPNITNPNITNPNITNPNVTNPNVTNVSATNPNITNPNITNPNVTNPNITNPNITNPNITNGSIQDVIYPITDNGNTTATYTVKVATGQAPPNGVLLQLILNKLYQTPVATNCQLTNETHWVTVANITNPKLYAANDPLLGNPNITNATPNEASVTLAPGETAYIDLRVFSPTKTPVNPLAYFVPVTIPQAVNTQTALANPNGGTAALPPVTVPPLSITTAALPDNVLTSAYSATVAVQGGNPGATHTFSVSSGTLPSGLTLNTATGAITGTPTVGGTFTFSIQAKDAAIGTQFPQHTTTQAFTIHVVSPLGVTPAGLPGGTQGTPYSASISPVGGQPPFTISLLTGSLPTGLNFNNNGAITGTPSATGLASFTVKITDSTNPPQSITPAFSINIVSSAPVPGNVTFVNQPLNSTGGQLLGGSPITVRVTDNTSAAIPGAQVAMTFNGAPACTGAVLSGTLTQTTGATGIATFPDLSVDRGQLGYTLRATVVGTTVAGNSNAFTVNGFCGTGNLIVSRLGQTSTLLQNGTVLITGGQVDQGPAATNEAEIYNPSTGAFTATTGTMTTARLNHTATLLNDGRVLIAGGAGTGGGSLPSAEAYNPTSGTFTATTGTLQSSRSSHTATLLADGTVLIAGGTNGDIVNSAEVFNPTANTFALVGTMTLGRQFHTATLLANGGVLITGGIATSGFTATAEIYDPVAKTFSSTGSMGTARQFHTATLLSSGKVLVAGGLQSNGATPIASAELFDPSLGSFAGTGSLNTARGIHTANLLTDGTVLVAGGYIGTSTALASSEIYSPTGGTFANTGTVMTGRYHHSTTLLNDGTVLAAAGSGIGVFMNSAERYFSTSPLAPLVLTTPNVSILADRAASQFLLEQGGVGPLTWSLQSGIGSLPAGINFDSSKGLFTGATENTGSFPLIVTITDSSSPESKSVVTHPTLNVIAPLTITTTTLPNAPTQNGAPGGTSAVAYSAQVLTIGGAGGATTFSLISGSGALPPSMTLNTATGAITSNNVTDAASPTPYTFTIQAVSAGPPSSTATQVLSITIVPLFFGNTSNNLQNGTVGSSYPPQNISAAGGIPPFTYSLISGGTGLPPGLSFSTLDSTTAQVTGTPTAAGDYNFFVSVHDSSSPAQGFSQQFFITVAPAAPPSETLAFTTQPSNATTGQALPPFVVQVLLNGALLDHVPVTVNFGNAACSSATLSGTTIAPTGPTPPGRATFDNVFINRGGRGYTLKATSTDPSAFATSTAFNAPGFCATGTMSAARYNHVAVKLPNGAVLVAGGNSSSGDSIATSETYAPDGGFVTNVNMQSARSSFTGTLLTAGPNAGQVLLVGGIVAASGTTTPSVELFDPTSATFTLGTSHMAVARFLHTATLLPNGDVLIAGGSSAFGSDVPTAEIYHAADGTFSAPINMASAHTNATATLLPNGKVLIAGGLKLISSTETSIAIAELFDPSTNTFTATGSMNVARSQHVAVLLPNGKVLVAGGVNASNMAEGSAELYDPSLGTFSTTGSLAAGGNAAAALLSTGKVLVIGGGAPQTNVAQLYDPTSGSFTTIQPMVNARADFPAVVLNDGTVLAAGGFNAPNAIANAELYYPDAPAAMQVTSRSNPGPGTSVFSDATAFSGNTNSSTPIGFNGIRPAGQDFAAFNPLVVSGISFSASGANVNVTRSNFYSPTYPADFIVDSYNSNSNMTNQVTIVLPTPTTALGIDYGGLGFSGASTGNITLSNGFVLPLASLPTVGTTQFSGFISSTPFSSLTYTANNDSWVVTDLLLAAANPDRSLVTEGSSYTQILLQQGGVGPLVWTLGSGSLPTGITLSSAGILRGQPSAGGVFTFGVHVVDSSNPPRTADSGNLTINVVPQPPTNAAQGPMTSSSVGLIWEFSLSSDVVGYNVYRASASGGPYTELASLNSSAVSYMDSAVQQDHVYYYVVTAVGPASLESVNSNEVAAAVASP